MITIIHGEDTVSSRNYFTGIKKDNPANFSFDNYTLNISSLLQIIKGSTLFNDSKTIFIEDFFSLKAPELISLKDLINKNHKNLNIFFWEGSEISKTNLSLFKDAETKLFKIPQNLFAFLDNIRPDRKENLISFHTALKTSDPEMIFYMLIRQFRLLIALSVKSDTIDEVSRLAPWQKDKLKRQAEFFGLEKLKKAYQKLFEIDLGVKTGTITNLTNSIDIFLLDI